MHTHETTKEEGAPERGATFAEVIAETVKVIRSFQSEEGRPWGVEGAVIELSKQVGDLAKLIMQHEGYYRRGRLSTGTDKIADELSDLLFVVIRIADHYKIDLLREHYAQLEAASAGIKARAQSR